MELGMVMDDHFDHGVDIKAKINVQMVLLALVLRTTEVEMW